MTMLIQTLSITGSTDLFTDDHNYNIGW